MIEHVVNNLAIDAKYTFIVQKEHVNKFQIDVVLESIVPDCNIVVIDGLTDGAARTLLHAKQFIDNIDPLFIVNSDNLIEWDNVDTMLALESEDGGIIVIEADGPKWSYAATNDAGYATQIAEKVQISTHATTGHYYWARGSDFVSCAEEMITRNIRFNNEFYIASVYNIVIERGLRILTKPAIKFWSVGTPEDLEYYLDNN